MTPIKRPMTFRERLFFIIFAACLLSLFAFTAWRIERDARAADAMQPPLPVVTKDLDGRVLTVDGRPVSSPPHTAPSLRPAPTGAVPVGPET